MTKVSPSTEENKNLLPPPLPKKCKEAISQLHELKKDLLEKQKVIIEQNKSIEEKVQKLKMLHPSIKINNEQRAAFEKDCDNYLKLLDSLMKEIDQRTEVIVKIIDASESKDKKVKTSTNELIMFIAQTQTNLAQVKQYIKMVKKNIAVSHSRFSFSFETQNKQLSFLEMQLSAKK